MKWRICLLVILWPLLNLSAQDSPQPISLNPLQIGDYVPDEIQSLPLRVVNHPDGKSTINLNDYKNKFIILDFWSTSCGACLAAMPKLDAVQNKLGNDIKIIPVTQESVGIVDPFWTKNPRTSKTRLYSVVNDTIFHWLFPHVVQPHVVWIGKEGIVKAITSTAHVTLENVQEILKKSTVSWPVKSELPSNYTEPLVSIDHNKLAKDVSLFYSVLTSRKLRMSMHTQVEVDSLAGTVYMQYMNHSIYNLYLKALNQFITLSPNRVTWEVRDSTKYRFFENNSAQQSRDEWNQHNLYCYEAVLPLSMTVQERKKRMINDLNSFLGLNGRMEKVERDCWILVTTSPPNKLKTEGGKAYSSLLSDDEIKRMRNVPLAVLVAALNKVEGNPPVVDETGNILPVDIDLKVDELSNIQALRAAIQPYGLDLENGKREIECFVLTETD